MSPGEIHRGMETISPHEDAHGPDFRIILFVPSKGRERVFFFMLDVQGVGLHAGLFLILSGLWRCLSGKPPPHLR